MIEEMNENDIAPFRNQDIDISTKHVNIHAYMKIREGLFQYPVLLVILCHKTRQKHTKPVQLDCQKSSKK